MGYRFMLAPSCSVLTECMEWGSSLGFLFPGTNPIHESFSLLTLSPPKGPTSLIPSPVSIEISTDEIWRDPFWPWASLVDQTVKRLPKMWETWVQSLGQEDPLEKEMATHSSILA